MEWHADIEVTDELVRACVSEQFPELLPFSDFTVMGEGWDNKAYLINNNIVFRFPRRQVAVELIERENQLLGNLHPRFELAIPNPEYIGEPSVLYPHVFQGYKLLNGTTGCHALLSEEQRAASIIPLARFLKQLHSIKQEEAKTIGARLQISHRADAKEMVPVLEKRVCHAKTQGIFHFSESAMTAELEHAKTLSPDPADIGLVHGDLYCRHLVFDGERLTGIIDWGDSGINHQAMDLNVIHGFYPQHCHDIFLQHYGDVSQHAWAHARFVAIYIAFTMMVFAHDKGDKRLYTEACQSMQRMNPAFFL